jgi:hypothetical protein
MTGMRLLDNHSTINAVRTVFDLDTEPYRRVLRTVRLAIIEECAREQVSLVSTFVYTHPVSLPYIELLRGLLGRYNSDLHLLRLIADRGVLDLRVLGENRSEQRKISTTARLESYLSSHDVEHIIPDTGLIIDNSTLSPTDVAERAILHFNLQRLTP